MKKTRLVAGFRRFVVLRRSFAGAQDGVNALELDEALCPQLFSRLPF